MSKPDETDDQLIKRSKALFDESVDELDGAALSQLNQRRHAAIDAAVQRPGISLWTRWLPASTLAAAAAIAVVMFRGPNVELDLDGLEAMTEFEILLDDESLDMIEELEFYSWLELADVDELEAELDSVG